MMQANETYFYGHQRHVNDILVSSCYWCGLGWGSVSSNCEKASKQQDIKLSHFNGSVCHFCQGYFLIVVTSFHAISLPLL